MQGVSAPATQSTLNYLLTGAIYGTIHLTRSRSSQKIGAPTSASGWALWAKCAAVAILDVEATYVNVLAYRFTSLTSVTLLDCTTIPGTATWYDHCLKELQMQPCTSLTGARLLDCTIIPENLL